MARFRSCMAPRALTRRGLSKTGCALSVGLLALSSTARALADPSPPPAYRIIDLGTLRPFQGAHATFGLKDTGLGCMAAAVNCIQASMPHSGSHTKNPSQPACSASCANSAARRALANGKTNPYRKVAPLQSVHSSARPLVLLPERRRGGVRAILSTDYALLRRCALRPASPIEAKAGGVAQRSRVVSGGFRAGGVDTSCSTCLGSSEHTASAAAPSPGAATYGKGGGAPTVTDANVVLGYLPSASRLGGEMRLDRDLA